MKKNTDNLVEHIAKLAQLQLSPDKIKEYEKQLSMILSHFEELKALDLSDVPETSRVIEEENIWREDVVETSLSQAAALKNSRRVHKGFFVVPYLLTGKDA
jgi:aspartyl-tRNA(Asn)/glutamyl-tRNA(Gln) amidotransferase subunit C